MLTYTEQYYTFKTVQSLAQSMSMYKLLTQIVTYYMCRHHKVPTKYVSTKCDLIKCFPLPNEYPQDVRVLS